MRHLTRIVICLALAALAVRAADSSLAVYADWSAGKQYLTDSGGTQLGTTAKPGLVVGDRVTVTLNILSNALTVGSLATGTYVASLTDGTNTLATLPTGTGTAGSAIVFPEWRVNSAALNAYIGDTSEHETFPSYRRGRNVTFLLTDTSGNTLVSDATFELHASRAVYDPAITRTALSSAFTHAYATNAVTLDPDAAAQVLVSDIPDADTIGYQSTTPTIDIASPVLIAVTVGTTAGSYTLTPGVAMTITDVWAVQRTAAGATGDRIRVSVGGATTYLTDALAWSQTAGTVVRADAMTATVATVPAGSVITVATSGAGSVAAGVLYLLGYRQGTDP